MYELIFERTTLKHSIDEGQVHKGSQAKFIYNILNIRNLR